MARCGSPEDDSRREGQHQLVAQELHQTLHDVGAEEDLFEAGLDGHQHDCEQQEDEESPVGRLERHLQLQDEPVEQERQQGNDESRQHAEQIALAVETLARGEELLQGLAVERPRDQPDAGQSGRKPQPAYSQLGDQGVPAGYAKGSGAVEKPAAGELYQDPQSQPGDDDDKQADNPAPPLVQAE